MVGAAAAAAPLPLMPPLLVLFATWVAHSTQALPQFAHPAIRPTRPVTPPPPRPQARVLPLLDGDPWVARYAWFALETSGWLGELDGHCGSVSQRREASVETSACAERPSAFVCVRLGVRSMASSVGSGQASPWAPLLRLPPLRPPTHPPTHPPPPGSSNSLMNVTTSTLTDMGRMYLSPGPAATHAAPRPAAAAAAAAAAAHTAQGHAATPGRPAAAAAAAEGGEQGVAAPSWTQLCDACIQHLEAGRPLAALPAAQQRECSQGCGFWPEASQATLGWWAVLAPPLAPVLPPPLPSSFHNLRIVPGTPGAI